MEGARDLRLSPLHSEDYWASKHAKGGGSLRPEIGSLKRIDLFVSSHMERAKGQQCY